MSQTVADYLLEPTASMGRRAQVFGYPGDGINGHPRSALGACRRPAAVHPGAARGDGGLRGRRVRQVRQTGSRGMHGDLRARARSTCSTASTTRSSTMFPVVAIVGQTNRTAMGGSYQQEVDLLSLFKDVAREATSTW